MSTESRRRTRPAYLRHPYAPAFFALLYGAALLGNVFAGLFVRHAPGFSAGPVAVTAYYRVHEHAGWVTVAFSAAATLFLYLFLRTLKSHLKGLRGDGRCWPSKRLGRALGWLYNAGMFTTIILGYLVCRVLALINGLFNANHKGGSAAVLHHANYLVNSGTATINTGFFILMTASGLLMAIFGWQRAWSLVVLAALSIPAVIPALILRGFGTWVWVMLVGVVLTVRAVHLRRHPREENVPVAAVVH